MDTFKRELVRAYIKSSTVTEAKETFILLEFHILKHLLDDYKKTNGHDAPNGYENNIDLRSIAETAILMCGGDIWHEE